jgi:signal transduction histidine kinase
MAGLPVFRSVKLLVLLTACTMLLALLVFGVITWRGMQHFGPIQQHTDSLTRLQQAGLRLEELTIRGFNGDKADAKEIDSLRRDLAVIAGRDVYLAPQTPQQLAAVETALSHLNGDRQAALFSAVTRIRRVLAAETAAHGRLLDDVRHDLILEFTGIGGAVLLLGGLGMLTLVRMRRRIFGPLNTLEQLLVLLAKRDYSLAVLENVDPIVQPLTASYNHLVNRLVELEAENARHRDTLQQEVSTATDALLEQQRNLAAAERLAATGEIAARIAHELRNPLAGMQMALTNIRTECSDRPDVVRRLDLVIDELRRVTGLLNGLLDQSRSKPESAVDLNLARTVEELLAILRYQIPKQVRLRRQIPDDLVCHLPKDRLRQVLLNLVLNSAEVIGESAGTITLRAATAGDTLELSVSDDGPGFPAVLLREGIGPFRSGRPGGTGLGLSIVARHIRNLDGRIELSNLKPHGACVTLTLPCRGASA